MANTINIELDIDEILSDDDKQRIIREMAERKFRESIHWNDRYGYKPDTVLANMCYEIVKQLFAEQLNGTDVEKYICDKVRKLIDGLSSYCFTGSSYDGNSDRMRYPANRIIDDAVKQNEQLLRDRIRQCVEKFEIRVNDEYDLGQMFADAFVERITKKSDKKKEAAK